KETIYKNSINIYGNKSSFATRGFLRSQNTNIVTATLPEVPGAEGDATLILPTLGTGYLGERCRRYIRVHQPRKPSSNKFRLIMFQILTKLQETTLILSTLGTRYFWEEYCRRDIRVQRP
ncbi:hypothetical protein TSAR_009090, partial [Trichomalopsis sarcophagae]